MFLLRRPLQPLPKQLQVTRRPGPDFAAFDRAERWLFRHLTPEQHRTYYRYHYFIVDSKRYPGLRYMIYNGWPCVQDNLGFTYCVSINRYLHKYASFSTPDQLLAILLMIKTNERKFCQTAVRSLERQPVSAAFQYESAHRKIRRRRLLRTIDRAVAGVKVLFQH